MSEKSTARTLRDKLLEQLVDDVDSEQLPAYVKAKLLGYLEKIDGGETETDEVVEQDFLDIVAESGLPLEKKLEMLEDEHERLHERIVEIERVMVSLHASQEPEATEIPVHEVR